MEKTQTVIPLPLFDLCTKFNFRMATKIVVTVLLIAVFASCSSCFEIRGFVDKVNSKFRETFAPNPKEKDDSVIGREEHGNFDFFGRDFIRKASKKIEDIRKVLKVTLSRDTQGLDCNKSLSDGKIGNFKSNVNAIYPGTKWCGDGNISKSFDDLGKFSDSDRCCRDHDVCPENIAADAEKFDLVNTGLFTRSHCDCDEQFYKCLKRADSLVSKSIGTTYFTVLGPQCFKQDYPIVGCLNEKKGKCVEYAIDELGEKRYQWFDSPPF